MKRRSTHATRSFFGIPRRRANAPAARPQPDRLAGILRFTGRSAFSLSLAAIMLVFIGLLVANFVGQIIQSSDLDARELELAAKVATSEAANAAYRAEVEFTESDVYAERVAREQLGYAREGDVVILPHELPAATPVATTPDVAPTAAPPAEQNWRLWWRALFPPEQ